MKRFRQGMLRLFGAGAFGSMPLWRSYLDVAYPGVKPADWAERLGRIDSLLREPGRVKAMQGMGRSAPTDAGAQLGNVRCPVWARSTPTGPTRTPRVRPSSMPCPPASAALR
ncbi:hypothetical protein ACFXCZ_31655 [Streptomyces sp. NPDC059396]|uniref:hypothetical protein n=1 Tax=Streptomyces sp. NPDC059396 TaxID=3346819 RepID=UPI0036B14C91